MPHTVKKLPKVRWLVLTGAVLLLALQFGSYALLAERRSVESLKELILDTDDSIHDYPPPPHSFSWAEVQLIGAKWVPTYLDEWAEFVLKYSKFPKPETFPFAHVESEDFLEFSFIKRTSSGLLPLSTHGVMAFRQKGIIPLFTQELRVDFIGFAPLPKGKGRKQVWFFGNWYTYQEFYLP